MSDDKEKMEREAEKAFEDAIDKAIEVSLNNKLISYDAMIAKLAIAQSKLTAFVCLRIFEKHQRKALDSASDKLIKILQSLPSKDEHSGENNQN